MEGMGRALDKQDESVKETLHYAEHYCKMQQ